MGGLRIDNGMLSLPAAQDTPSHGIPTPVAGPWERATAVSCGPLGN